MNDMYSGNVYKFSSKGMLIAVQNRMIKNLSSELARRWVRTRKNATLATAMLP
jgi:hypothetical protein